MVESWDVSDDGLTWSFTLRDGLTFHDGTPVTSDDVRSTYERWLPSWYALAGLMREFQDEDSFVVTDDKSFQIVLNEPTGSVIMSLAKPYGSPRIMPTRLDEDLPASEAAAEWVGSGPYKFVDWSQGDRITIARFDGFVSRTEPASLYTGEIKAYID
jgi:peptide/nickel transport system substrate-binding protein